MLFYTMYSLKYPAIIYCTKGVGMSFKKIVFFIVALTGVHNAFPALLIKGDIDSTTESFSFKLGPHILAQTNGVFFATAAEEKADNEFAVSLAGPDNDHFFALAVPIVTLNNIPNQPNPLTGAAIDHLDLMGILPLVVKKNDADKVFYFSRLRPASQEEIPQEESDVSKEASKKKKDTSKKIEEAEDNGTRIIESPIANDANGDPTQGILGIVGGAILGKKRKFYAVVQPKGGVFGDDGSGVAVGQFFHTGENAEEESTDKKTEAKDKKGTKEKEEKKKLKEELDEEITFFDAVTGTFNGNKAAPLDRTSDALGLSNPLTSIKDDPIKPLFIETLKTLYVPLQVTAGVGGARGIALGRTHARKVTFKAIAPDSAFGADNIVGSNVSGTDVSLFAVRATMTSTALPYIIVVGGVGSPVAVSKSVFALPIVNKKEENQLGVIAKKDQTPIYTPGGNPNLFGEPAVTEADMPSPTDAAALVGGGDAPGVVTDIVVATDAVFISVKDAMGVDGGLFYSQALFDDLGRIRAWTAWQRVGGPDAAQDTQGFAYDRFRVNFWFMPLDGTDPSKTVFRTCWDTVDDENNTVLSMTLTNLFSDVASGIQDLKSYPEDNQGFSQQATKKLSLSVATGNNQVVLVETGNDRDGDFGPTTDFSSTYTSTDGTLTSFAAGVQVLSISGGVLEDIGPIVASTVVTDGTYGWLVVAGSGGMAVLADDDGNGWPVAGPVGLENGFSGLSDSMSFKPLGTRTTIFKLVSEEDKLFVITPSSLDRITLSASVIKNTPSDNGTELAASGVESALNTFLTDVMISKDFALLAASGQLLRIGSGKDIRTVTSQEDAEWQEVELPYSVGGTSRIISIGTFPGETSLVDEGNIYIINVSPSNNQARIYRFVINGTDASNRTLVLFPDFFTNLTLRVYLASLGQYRAYLLFDGAALFLTGTPFGNPVLAVAAATRGIQPGNRGLVNGIKELIVFPEAGIIGSVVRDFGSGSLMAWGDFGARLLG